MIKLTAPWKLWTGLFSVGLLGVASLFIYLTTVSAPSKVQSKEVEAPVVEQQQDDSEPAPSQPLTLTVIKPRKGAMQRVTTQPGSVQAFESVQLFAKVPGFLKSQSVDIGARVKKDQVLAVVDVPELDKQVQRNHAAVDQADAKVLQMKARIASARADLDAAKAEVTQAEATAKSSAAWVRFRALQYQRMKDLFATHSIEEKLVDESKERYEASVETENASQAAVITTRAKVVAATAKIQQAEADVAAAQSEVKLAQAELEKSEVLVKFATIKAPFDGVVTFRGMVPNDFVRAANESGSQPLLTVQRTDLMRVVVQVPDRDVIYVDPGDPATLEIDALPGQVFHAKVSRMAQSQDAKTRLMHVEIDLPNPTGKMHNGMYGRATILLDKATEKLSIPSSCLVNKSEDGTKAFVYVVRASHAHRVQVQLGEDNGLRVEILRGIDATDDVVLSPSHSLPNDVEVHATFWDEAPPK